jgi:diaminopimelate decarboxylase
VTGLARIAGTWGTPAYVYDRADVRAAHDHLRRSLPSGSAIYFSLKANPHPDVASVLAGAGCRAEVASGGEVDLALAAGFAPEHILLTGPGKSEVDIRGALAAGVRRFSVDSPTDLARLGRIAMRHGCEVSCLLRMNADQPVPGMGLSMTGTSSQFGADASWILSSPRRFLASGAARVHGLHLYMGTNITDVEVLLHQFETSVALAKKIAVALDIPLTEVDLGGGFGMPYARAGDRPDFGVLAARLEPVLDSALPGWRSGAPRLAFESGRYLTGGCGTLLCGVLDVKRSKGRTYVVLDTGINHLGGMSGLRRIPRIVPDLLPPVPAGESLDDCAVVGPLCTPLDVWSQGVRLRRVAPGDVVGIPNVGAYGLTASLLAFLSHRSPVEIVLDGEELVSASRLVSGRQSVNEREAT